MSDAADVDMADAGPLTAPPGLRAPPGFELGRTATGLRPPPGFGLAVTATGPTFFHDRDDD